MDLNNGPAYAPYQAKHEENGHISTIATAPLLTNELPMPVTSQPITINTTIVPDRPNGFNNDVFDCCGDCTSCWKAMCCPCIINADVARSIGDSGACWCCLSILCGFWSPCLICYQRGNLRNRLGITGSACSDLMVAFFCACCVLVQMDREVHKR